MWDLFVTLSRANQSLFPLFSCLFRASIAAREQMLQPLFVRLSKIGLGKKEEEEVKGEGVERLEDSFYWAFMNFACLDSGSLARVLFT